MAEPVAMKYKVCCLIINESVTDAVKDTVTDSEGWSDEIPAIVEIKNGKENIVKPLVNIWQKSLKMGAIPSPK